MNEARFAFGKNWKRLLPQIDGDRIATAEASLRGLLERDRLEGIRFLDVGSGSGLFSLAARRLGATVTSFDYDRDSVECTSTLRRVHFPDDPTWRVLQGSVLDASFMESLEVHDVVYAWGVLHHTGAMWEAIDQATQRVSSGGRLVLALYNDQGAWSRRWAWVKWAFNSHPVAQAGVLAAFLPYFAAQGAVVDVLARKSPFRRYREYRRERGMSLLVDWVDWLGGYPFEVAKPEEVVDFLLKRGLRLRRLRTVSGEEGCNEFVFERLAQT